MCKKTQCKFPSAWILALGIAITITVLPDKHYANIISPQQEDDNKISAPQYSRAVKKLQNYQLARIVSTDKSERQLNIKAIANKDPIEKANDKIIEKAIVATNDNKINNNKINVDKSNEKVNNKVNNKVNDKNNVANNNADNSGGEFVRSLASYYGQRNYWDYLKDKMDNSYLYDQLSMLKNHLSDRSLYKVEIFYSDYVKNERSLPQNSRIIAVRGTSKDKQWLYFARHEKGNVYYYDYDGEVPEPSMDRAPLRYSRITSKFSPRRRHPISGRIQPHQGVDLKGAYGADIHVTGDGKVRFAGWQHGYGRIVIVTHPYGYETRYAHLSAINVSQNQVVKRGTVVGKLGNSGASTGAHLHYEFRKNGVAYDPLIAKLPTFNPLDRSDIKIWHYRAAQFQLAMNEMAAIKNVASNENLLKSNSKLK